MQRNPSNDDIADVIAQIDAELPWSVEDWGHETGKFESPMLTLELEWCPVQALDPEDGTVLKRATLDAIEHHGGGEGALIDDVVSAVSDAVDGTDREDVETIIDGLKQKGEVYEPQTDHLRRT